jgi:D-alanyl-D-alanine carboxypeptidase (penicillin-binding protein 5/6)
MQRKATSLLPVCLAFAALFNLSPAWSAEPTRAYLVMDATTRHVLDALNPEKKSQIGSLTKIATAMVVLDWAELRTEDMGQLATVEAPHALVEAGNAINFQPGDRVSLRDLLYAAMMQSDNVAAYTLADHVGRALQKTPEEGSPQDVFVTQMNALARSLGMERTLFVNPHGLETNERRLPYSTARDVALLARYAMSKSAFRFYVSQKERKITVQQANGFQSQYMLQNTNELLGRDGIDGVKTGKTRRAGECVVISAAQAPESKKEGETYTITPRRLIVVVLGSTARFPVAAGLLEQGWRLYDQWAAEGRPVKKGQAF